MAMNTLYQPLIKTHVEQDYGDFDQHVAVDHLLRKYKALPGALYLVDCRTAQLEPITKNFSKVIGIECSNRNDITQLYEHVHPSNLGALLKFTQKAVQCGFDRTIRVIEEVDFLSCVYLTRDERVILKCTSVLHYDSKGTMRYTFGKLMDITGLVPFTHFGYTFTGPNSNLLNQKLEDDDAESILGRRELEVLHLIGEQKSSREIGCQLFISKNTVDTHRRNIIKKLNCKDSYEAFLKAKNLGML